jgi:DNA-binding response OmpR family regulator
MTETPSVNARSLAIVDPDISHYDALIAPAVRRSFRIRHFGSGQEALRHAHEDRTAAWIVSAELPDMPGFDLVEMLRDKLHPRLMWMVASQYRAEDEIRAYRSGATMYACKPLDGRWLQEALHGCLARTQTVSLSIPKRGAMR